MDKEKIIYLWYKSAGKLVEYKGIRCATEEEHKSDSGYLYPGEVEQKIMDCEPLLGKSHEAICDEILSSINSTFIFSDDDREQLIEDVRSLAESLI